MKSGDRWEGDILVGADGIYSKASYHLKMTLHCFNTQGTAMFDRYKKLHMTLHVLSNAPA